MIYNVLISAVQQSDSVIYIYNNIYIFPDCFILSTGGYSLDFVSSFCLEEEGTRSFLKSVCSCLWKAAVPASGAPHQRKGNRKAK